MPQRTDGTETGTISEAWSESNAPFRSEIRGISTTEPESRRSTDPLADGVNHGEIPGAKEYAVENSDTLWLQSPKQKDVQSSEQSSGRLHTQPHASPRGLVTSDMSSGNKRQRRSLSHLDEREILTTSSVDAYEMPTGEVAGNLFDHFMNNVNTEFPFVEINWTRDLAFNAIVEAQNRGEAYTESKQRAILNIIFAIGATYAHLIGEGQGDERDHVLYSTRARMLGLHGEWLLDQPTVQLVQVAALTGFYYLCSSQISRSSPQVRQHVSMC